MSVRLQRLWDEHSHLYSRIERLRATADACGLLSLGTLRNQIDDLYRMLRREVIPHARAEEETLYPLVEHLMDAPYASATMVRDHGEIAMLTQELRGFQLGLAPPQAQPDVIGLRRVLYSLYAIIVLHIAKEEEYYFPLLKVRLTDAQLEDLFAKMEDAEARARREAELEASAKA